MTPRRALGIDIGGTKIAAAMVDEDGTTATPLIVPTPAADGPDAILDAAAALARRVMTEAGSIPEAVGLGSAGAFDLRGTVIHSTDHLAGWLGTRVGQGLEARLDLPVTVLNDVHAAALGELSVGPDRGVGPQLFVAVGTGIGGALIVNDRLIRGSSGMAGSVGHVRVRSELSRQCSCGGRDHAEAFASGPAMERTYRERTGIDARLPSIGERSRRGDSDAADVIESATGRLAEALAAAISVCDVETIILGGGVSGLGTIFTAPLSASLRAELGARSPQVRVELAALGDRATVVGAATAAWRIGTGSTIEELFV
ncbi:ROK family protein [Leifsonia sp. NPDC056824]|uniref:ROK family protein n=1 Tax=Leifsonia sp. NPDC056824 TaxID=3345953 RepID=UPI00368EB362